jgi:FeS assembly protein IscX
VLLVGQRLDPIKQSRYTFRVMKLTWKDFEEIAWALMDKFPDQDPLKLSFPKLHKMVTELEDFQDNPEGSNEKILENIQMTWYEEKK